MEQQVSLAPLLAIFIFHYPPDERVMSVMRTEDFTAQLHNSPLQITEHDVGNEFISYAHHSHFNSH